MNDLEFVQRCVKGDKQAWDEFIERYSRLIYSYIRGVLGSRGYLLTPENTNDLFQEIFHLLYKDNFSKLKSFKAKNGCSLASWLRIVAVNTAIDYLRRSKPVVPLDDHANGEESRESLQSDAKSALYSAIESEKLGALNDCIDKLELDDRYFLELHIKRNLSLEIIKDHFKVSRGAIDMRKFRIVDRLRECFKAKGFIFSPQELNAGKKR